MPHFARVCSSITPWRRRSCWRLRKGCAALLVPTPTPSIVAAIRAILKAHNPIEEGPDGLYAQCEQVAGVEADRILAQLQAAPEVKVAPHIETAQVLEATRRALVKAGYALEV